MTRITFSDLFYRHISEERFYWTVLGFRFQLSQTIYLLAIIKFLSTLSLMSLKMSCWALLLFLLEFVFSVNAGECPKPVLEGNVRLTDSALLKNNFPNGSVITLQCAVGYGVDQGSNTITCVSGDWSKQELTCKKKDCKYPPSTPNMQYEIPNGTLFGAFIKPFCNQGYYLQGSSYRQCLASGWTGRPRCLLVTCGEPPKIPNSIIVNGPIKDILKFEDVIEYRCEDSYTLIGNGSVVCLENRSYSSLPKCEGECLKPVLEGNVKLPDSALLKNNFPDGSEITLECANGYEVDQGSNTITCVSGNWSKQELTCKMVTCGEPPEIPHSIIVNGPIKEILEFEDVIEYRCEDSYTLIGSGSVVCLENRSYSSLPECKVVTCGEPPEILHSIKVKFEDVIEYRCEDSYTLIGNGSVVCLENGSYSPLPECEEKQSERVITSNWGSIAIVISIVIAACIIIIVILLRYCQKQKGSYDTREVQKTKEGLIHESSYHYI